MRKIIDRLIKWLSTPEQQQQTSKVISFNVPLERLEEWTAETLEEWLKLIGTPDNKIKETVLDIRLQAERAGVSLKEPRRVWNKFTVGKDLSLDDLFEQKDAISKALGFGDSYDSPSEKDGICLRLFHDVNGDTHCITLARIHSNASDSIKDFPVVDSQLDLDEIRSAIAKLKENSNENK